MTRGVANLLESLSNCATMGLFGSASLDFLGRSGRNWISRTTPGPEVVVTTSRCPTGASGMPHNTTLAVDGTSLRWISLRGPTDTEEGGNNHRGAGHRGSSAGQRRCVAHLVVRHLPSRRDRHRPATTHSHNMLPPWGCLRPTSFITR